MRSPRSTDSSYTKRRCGVWRSLRFRDTSRCSQVAAARSPSSVRSRSSRLRVDRDVDRDLLQVGRHLRAGHGDEARDAGVLEAAREDRAELVPELLGDAGGPAVGRHGRVTPRRSRPPRRAPPPPRPPRASASAPRRCRRRTGRSRSRAPVTWICPPCIDATKSATLSSDSFTNAWSLPTAATPTTLFCQRSFSRDLGDRHVEPGLHPVDRRAQEVPLRLERPRLGEVQREAEHADEHPRPPSPIARAGPRGRSSSAGLVRR